MKDILSQVTSLKRPKILVRAARFGLDDYIRDRHLRRCLKRDTTPSPGQALVALLDVEKQLNSERKTKSGDYHAAKHIDVLVAIMAEAQLFRAITRPTL
ncbi:MAG: DUF6477 family protein [Pseudomonadota bacterium]